MKVSKKRARKQQAVVEGLPAYQRGISKQVFKASDFKNFSIELEKFLFKIALAEYQKNGRGLLLVTDSSSITHPEYATLSSLVDSEGKNDIIFAILKKILHDYDPLTQFLFLDLSKAKTDKNLVVRRVTPSRRKVGIKLLEEDCDKS